MFRHPLFFPDGQRRLFESRQQLRVARVPSCVFLIGSAAPLLGLVVRKNGVVLRRDVAQVAQKVHYLVVAEQGHDLPSRFCGFFLQPHE